MLKIMGMSKDAQEKLNGRRGIKASQREIIIKKLFIKYKL